MGPRFLLPVLSVLLLLTPVAWGQQSVDNDPYHLVRDATTRVMQVVSSAQDYVQEDPDRYYRQVQDILDPLIDYRGFARGVMGAYASSERYRSLDEAGRAQLRDQLDRFTQVIRQGLVRTYSKGLLAYAQARIEVPPPAAGENTDAARVSVQQLVYTDKVEPYVILYQMKRDRTGSWKLRNVIIDSVNLGEIYRSQFEAEARKYEGDLDRVIANWSTVDVDADA